MIEVTLYGPRNRFIIRLHRHRQFDLERSKRPIFLLNPQHFAPETNNLEKLKMNLELVNVISLVMPEVGRGTYRGTSVIRNRAPLGPYSRTIPRAL